MSTENYYIAASGNWSTDANWSLGHKPTTGEAGFANGKSITIDESITCDSITTAAGVTAVAGGSFTASSGITINANIPAGTTTCLSSNGISYNVNGVVTGGSSTNAVGIAHLNSGGPYIIGALNGGSASGAHGLTTSISTGDPILIGDATGGSNSNAAAFVGRLTVTGDLLPGTAGAAAILYNTPVTINGNVYGSSSANVPGVNFGNIFASVTVNGKLVAGTNSAAVTGSQSTLKCDGIEYATNGQPPTSLKLFFNDVTIATAKVYQNDGTTNATLQAGGGSASYNPFATPFVFGSKT